MWKLTVWVGYWKAKITLNYIKINGTNLNVHQQRKDKYWYSYDNRIACSSENEWTKVSYINLVESHKH